MLRGIFGLAPGPISLLSVWAARRLRALSYLIIWRSRLGLKYSWARCSTKMPAASTAFFELLQRPPDRIARLQTSCQRFASGRQ
jgi:hypothetical protein